MSVDVFEMFAKLSMDSSDFDKGLEKVSNTAKSVAKGISVAVGAGATAIGLLTKKAVDSYSDYEQNAGGIKKLYGDAYNSVMKNAVNAYKTSGMSANKYMETATQFSASLISSLKGNSEEASKQTEVAMRAISDNWNTFGGDLESITDAYKGFSKQNYTMLDNLKLGYGGTKEEMERLIDDANEYAKTIGKASDMSIDSFSDIVTAIELVQEKQGVAGTTAKEAQTTIQGSLNMTKMAWENLLVAFGNTEVEGYLDNVGEAVDTFVSSATVAFNNVLPVVEKAFQGIVQAIGAVIPIINKELPTMISTLLPSLLTSAAALVSGIVSALPALLSSIVETIPTIISTLMTQVDWSGIYASMSEALSSVVTVFQELGTKVFEWFTGDGLAQLIQCGTQWIVGLSQGLIEGIPNLLEQALPMILQFAESLRANFGTIVDAGIEFLQNLVQGIANGLPQLIAYVPQIIIEFCGLINDNLPKLLVAGVQMLITLGQGIINAIPDLLANIPKIFEAVIAVWSALNWIDLGKNLIKWVTDGIKNLSSQIPNAVKTIGQNAKNFFSNIDWSGAGHNAIKLIATAARSIGNLVWTAVGNIGKSAFNSFKNINWADLGSNLVRGIWNGISNMTGWIINLIGGFTNKVLKSIKGFFGIHSPSKKTAWVGKMLMYGMSKGIDDNASEVISSMADMGKEVMKEADSMSIKASVKAIGESVTDSNKSEGSSKFKTSGGIVINVYASEGMDIDELVEELMIKLEKARKKEEEVFA